MELARLCLAVSDMTLSVGKEERSACSDEERRGRLPDVPIRRAEGPFTWRVVVAKIWYKTRSNQFLWDRSTARSTCLPPQGHGDPIQCALLHRVALDLLVEL